MSIYRIARALSFSGIFSFSYTTELKLCSMFIQHKFTAQEFREEKATVCKAVVNWRRHSKLEHANGVLNHFIYK
ncbi:hypothetical protein BRARA_G01988 [Brassica rapa]|uniref:Uncharacterized protein n=1 Tax=Brassica campestris TaxID=3711 RepID=A0A397YV31_BRACM|nr:hypothetical protein BRARA_G01988 [Brassica rapa]